MSNTISISEPDVNDLMLSYAGLRLERAASATAPFSLVVQIPYVTNQTTYLYEDSTGGASDWYRVARYAPSGSIGAYSPPWSVTPIAGGITLADLERETARRIGPFYRLFTDRQVPNTAQFTYANFPELRSELDLDSVTNLWLLRRGIDWQNNPLSFDVAERQRTVASYDAQSGRVFPDRPWGILPAAGEVCEFHHLNPEQELRPAVLAGLRRCFLPDTVQAQPSTTSSYGVDLTSQFPWLRDTWQITRVRYNPYQDTPWDTYSSGGHLIINSVRGGYLPSKIWIDAWRPAWSRVNGVESSGPVADDDTLEVDLDYAAAAAHIEAWHHFPSRLQAAAAGGLQSTQAMAAQEFSRQAMLFGPRRPVSVGFQQIVRIGHSSGARTWVNGPW